MAAVRSETQQKMQSYSFELKYLIAGHTKAYQGKGERYSGRKWCFFSHTLLKRKAHWRIGKQKQKKYVIISPRFHLGLCKTLVAIFHYFVTFHKVNDWKEMCAGD